jgi:transposase
MAQRFKNIDRPTPMLLPPVLRDWVDEDDLVHFVIAAVERLPLSRFAVNYKGCGDAQYPPHLLLALLIYCCANGIFSSRRLERASYRDIAVRYLCADTHPRTWDVRRTQSAPS